MNFDEIRKQLARVIEPVATDELPEPLTPYEEFSAGLDARMARLNQDEAAKKKGAKHPDYTGFVRKVLMNENGTSAGTLMTQRINR